MKRAYIPQEYRPVVPGTTLVSQNCNRFEISDDLKMLSQTIAVFSSKGDIVAKNFWGNFEHKNQAIHLYFDDLGYFWDFIYDGQSLVVLTKEGKLFPSSIYHRHPGVAQDHECYSRHIAFFEIVDMWDGNQIGQKRDHFHNASKPFQMHTSISQALKKVCTENVTIPKTNIVKGNVSKVSERMVKHRVVKSCSGMRSIVVSDKDCKSWDHSNINHVPVLFQEQIEGIDIRVHKIDNTFWALSVISKSQIDYRYSDKKELVYTVLELPEELKQFCREVSRLENNRFVGIDLIQVGNLFYCLESNPGPGWSTYAHSSKHQFNEAFGNILNLTSKRKNTYENSTFCNCL